MILLGIETSCDETAAAFVDDSRHILADIVLQQGELHQKFGGVVPEIAARAHLQHLDGLVGAAIRQAGLSLADVNGVAVTGGPGLIGGVIVGVMTAKAIAAVRNVPFLAINHLEGHALTVRLTQGLPFPYLLLLVSGGHSLLLVVEGVGRYYKLGTTIDDAAGEAFDKVAKMLGLSYPGGPAIEQYALAGDPHRFHLPRPMKGRAGCDFSFSGLKTAVRQILCKLDIITQQIIVDIAASFQEAVIDILMDRTRKAIKVFRRGWPEGGVLVVSGGVAANKLLRKHLTILAHAENLRFIAPPFRLCTDNAVMIAWAGIERLRIGSYDSLDFRPRSRWPLDDSA